MAWWEIGEGGDISGDGVADILGAAHEAMLAGWGDGPHDLADLLRTWQDALNAEVRGLVDDAEASAFALSAEVTPLRAGDDAPARMVTASTSPSGVPDRAGALEALREVMMTYNDATDRAPRIRELAYGLAFSLVGPAEDGYFSQGPCRIVRIVIEPHPERGAQ